MKEHPILYSTPMVQAKLQGRKTQTRRVIKDSFNGCLTGGGPHPCPNDPVLLIPGETMEHPFEEGKTLTIDYPQVRAIFFCSTLEAEAKCPYGKPGDLLWVRETYAYVDFAGEENGYVYKASDPDWESMEGWRWKPSIFMPKAAARIWERVTTIRAERLHDITLEDMKKEGLWFNAMEGDTREYEAYFDHWADLWTSINGPDSWAANPWVWVIETEILSTTGKPQNL